MTRARACFALAMFIPLAGPAFAEAPPFHTEPSGGGEHAVIIERWRREEGDFFGFAVLVEQVGPAGRQRQRYSVQCDRSDSAQPGVWLGRGSAIQSFAVQPERAPSAEERFSYNLWWAVCRRLLQRY